MPEWGSYGPTPEPGLHDPWGGDVPTPRYGSALDPFSRPESEEVVPIPPLWRRIGPSGAGRGAGTAANYEVWLTRDDGTRLCVLDDWESLSYTLSAREVGTVELVLPGDWSTQLFAADRKLEVWRKPQGGAMALERAFLISGIDEETNADGLRRIALTGVDGNHLLTRRIAAYTADSTGAYRTAAADSLLKDLVSLNLSTGCTDTGRAYSTGYFTVEGKSSAGTQVTKQFSRREVLAVCQEICDTVRATTATNVYFDVCSPTPGTYEFRTYLGQIGIDHTYPSGQNPVLVGLEYGNLTEPSVEMDYADEKTVIYGGGRGEAGSRTIYEAEDAARSGRSLWGRKEAFKDARSQASSSGLMDEARAALDEGRPTLRFSGGLMDSPGTLYGVHWRWGDKVTASYNGQSYDVTVDVVTVTRDAAGESIEAKLGYEE